MLTLTPTQVIYFCTRDTTDAQYGVQQATIALHPDSPRSGEYAKFTIRDAKCTETRERTVSVQEYTSATVYIHDSDKNYTAYVTWYSDGTVGIDCPDEVKILRQRLMIDCGFKPEWEYER